MSSKQDEIPKDKGHAASLTPILSFSEHRVASAYSFPLLPNPGLNDVHQLRLALSSEIKSWIIDKIVKCTTLRMQVQFIISFIPLFPKLPYKRREANQLLYLKWLGFNLPSCLLIVAITLIV